MGGLQDGWLVKAEGCMAKNIGNGQIHGERDGNGCTHTWLVKNVWLDRRLVMTACLDRYVTNSYNGLMADNTCIVL